MGQGVLHEALRDENVARVTILGRHPNGHHDPRITEVLVEDFAELAAVEERLRGIEACLYCAGAPPIGTPEDAYRHVTLARLNPGMRFLYVSVTNANAASRFMPLRVKGEAEQALQALPLRSTMLRPGGIQPAHGERSPASTSPLVI